MSDKKVCEVCGREKWQRGITADPEDSCDFKTQSSSTESDPDGAECYRLGYERERAKAAILTPEVLRLIEAAKKWAAIGREEEPMTVTDAGFAAHSEFIDAALALPFEKPAESALHVHAWVRFELCERGGHYVTGTGATCHPSPCVPAEQLPKKGGE